MNTLQSEILDIYKIFQDLCQEHKLRYYARGGTEIGAVREGGFIGWDDDMDIEMPLPDYEKFISLKDDLPENIKFLNCLSPNNTWSILFGKLHNTQTTYTEFHAMGNRENWTGCFIDIMPDIGVPRKKVDKDLFLKHFDYLRVQIRNLNQNRDTNQLAKVLKEYDKHIHKYDFDDSEYYFCVNDQQDWGRRNKNVKIMKFEDTTIPVRLDFDSHLSKRYGSYMTPKREASNHSSDDAIIDIKKAYTHYRDIKVSIIIPAYNVEKYIETCLFSVVNQTYDQLEIIIVDDKSPDKSGEIADQFAKNDPRIKVVHKHKNEGLNAARATGFAESTGQFIVFVDSDDKVSLDYVEKLMFEQRKTQADVVMCGYIHYNEQLDLPLAEQPFKQYPIKEISTIYTQDEIIKLYLTQWDNWKHNNNITTAYCKLYSRSVINNINWKQCDYTIGEDDFETIYTLNKITKVAVINDQNYFYRANPDSISNSKKFTPRYQGEKISVFKICKDFESKSLLLLDEKYKEEIYYRVYNLYIYYINLLLNKGKVTIEDILEFDKSFPTKEFKCLKKYKFNDNILNNIEEGGLLNHLTQQLSELKRADSDRTQMLEQKIDHQNKEIEQLSSELSSYLGVKRSARIFAGNLKRKIKSR